MTREIGAAPIFTSASHHLCLLQVSGSKWGDMPSTGTMAYRVVPKGLPGFEDYHSIQITYNFQNGIQVRRKRAERTAHFYWGYSATLRKTHLTIEGPLSFDSAFMTFLAMEACRMRERCQIEVSNRKVDSILVNRIVVFNLK